MRPVPIVSALLALLVILAACASPAPTTVGAPRVEGESSELTAIERADGARLTVMATTTIVADVVASVAGEMAEVASLLPIGADPHAFTPAPRDMAMLRDADIIMANGAGLEEFLEAYISSAGEGVPVVYLSDGIALREFEPHEDDADDDHEGIDPHTWTSPASVIVFARNAAEALATLDPANAEAYQANAEAYIAELDELDRWVREQIATIPEEDRLLVSDHDVFGYYADRYGLEQLGAVIPAFSSAAQPSARDLADLQTAMRERDVKAVFVGTSVNPALAQQVAEDLGIAVVPLYTGSLGEAGSGAETYIGYTRYNTNAIVQALR